MSFDSASAVGSAVRNRDRRSQALVIGGGPAGASTAWHLAQAGVQVTLLDRARFPRDKPCGEYLSPEGARILEAMGMLPAVYAAGAAKLEGMTVRAPSGEIIRGEFVAQHGFRGFRDHGIALRRISFDALLLDCARSAGVNVVENVKVESLITDGGACVGVRARTEHGVQDFHAPLVVGADGLRSIVARRLKLARQSRWIKRVAIVSHYAGVVGLPPVGEMHVTSNGYVGLAAVGHGITNVSLVVPARSARDINGDAAAYLERWLAAQPQLDQRLGGARRIESVLTTGPFASRAVRSWAPGAALVGDAADFFDPFTGEGIYAALRGGELLAPFALDAINARSTERANYALRAYDDARRETFAGKWRVERLIGMAVASPALINRAARVLSRDRRTADLLVGVTGDFVPPREVLRSSVLLPMLLRMLIPGLAPSIADGSASPVATPVV